MKDGAGKISMWQKILIMLGVISICLIAFPLVSLLLLTVLYKFVPNNFIYTLALAVPFIWAPILGIIFGIIISLKIIFLKAK